MSPRADKFLERVVEYAEKTGVGLIQVPRRGSWSSLGLPDLRGFTPHLRQVNVYEDSGIRNFTDLLSASRPAENVLWLFHDILHVLFYDFATINLGRESWDDRNRFFESHLASELFAVLALDYHYLVCTDLPELTIKLKAADWPRFREACPELPAFDTFEFCGELAKLYLGGGGLVAALGSSGAGKKGKFADWVGHEIRYTEKQRHYVVAWRDDLNAAKIKNKKVDIHESFVGEAVWELLRIFHFPENGEFESWTEQASGFFSSEENAFENYPKYREKRESYDFRFTDVIAVEKPRIASQLAAAHTPRAANLFLFYQILALSSPSLFFSEDRARVQTLHLSAQSPKVDIAAWRYVKKLCENMLKRIEWKAQPRGISTFFLP